MNRPLAFAALAEAAIGLALLMSPELVVRLLLGAQVAGVGAAISRVIEIALIALGIAWWPGIALAGMCTYRALVTAFLAYLGIRGEWAEPLLWPAVAVHATLTFLLARAWLREPRLNEVNYRAELNKLK